jgi:hypothetical protein
LRVWLRPASPDVADRLYAGTACMQTDTPACACRSQEAFGPSSPRRSPCAASCSTCPTVNLVHPCNNGAEGDALNATARFQNTFIYMILLYNVRLMPPPSSPSPSPAPHGRLGRGLLRPETTRPSAPSRRLRPLRQRLFHRWPRPPSSRASSRVNCSRCF